MRKNIILVGLYHVLILIIPFITLPYISRIIGSEGIGVYAYTESIAKYFILICHLGIQIYGRREIAKVNDTPQKYSKVFIEIYSIQISMFLVAFILYLLFTNLAGGNLKTAMMIQIVYVFSGLLDINWLYFGLEKFRIIVLRNVVIKSFSIVMIFLLIKSNSDIYLYISIIALSELLSQSVLWINLRRYIKFTKPNYTDVKKRFIPILKLFIPTLAIQLFSIVDKTMLGMMADVQQVGLYENANKIARVPISIITSLGVVMLPRMTSLFENKDNTSAEKYIENSLILTVFIAIATSFGIFSISDIFIPLYLGDQFSGSISIVKVLSLVVIFITWGNVIRTQYILPRGMDDLYTKSVILAATINIFLNGLLIPKFQAVGAAVASLSSEAFICIYQSFTLRRQLKITKYLIKSFKYVVSGSIMVLIVLFMGVKLKTSYETLMYQVLGGASMYLWASIIFERIFNESFILFQINKIISRIKTIMRNRKVK